MLAARTDDGRFGPPGFPVGTTRSYGSFSQMLQEAIDARVWSGIHFQTADEDGARVGAKVARFSTRHYVGPIRHHHW